MEATEQSTDDEVKGAAPAPSVLGGSWDLVTAHCRGQSPILRI